MRMRYIANENARTDCKIWHVKNVDADVSAISVGSGVGVECDFVFG